MEVKQDNSNSYAIKTSKGVFVGYLNLKKGINATPEQVSALVNKSKDLIIEPADAQVSENPFAEFAAS